MTKQMLDLIAASRKKTMSSNEILLEDVFEVFPNEKVRYKVELTRTGITYYPADNMKLMKTVEYVHFGDVIGCRCKKSLNDKHAKKAYLTVFAYPLKKKMFSETRMRHKKHITFARSTDSLFDENRKVVEIWRLVILHLCKELPINKKDIDSCHAPPKTSFLVLVNPQSGPGKAMEIYQKQVKPMLDEADIAVTVIKTDHAGHGTELMKTIHINSYYGIVIVSGDGLIYEVINGLMNRDDWQDVMKFPIGCLPGGSGNALSCSIKYLAGEAVHANTVLHSTFILIKHHVIPMDLVLIEQPHQRIFSFLSVTWGLLGDIDFESEKYRYMGEARFTVQAIKRILSLRKYKGRLSFLPVKEYVPKTLNNNSQFQNDFSNGRRVSLTDKDYVKKFQATQHSKSVPNQLFLGKTLSDLDISEIDENVESLTDIPESCVSIDVCSTSETKADFVNSDEADVKFSLANEENYCSEASVDKSKDSEMQNTLETLDRTTDKFHSVLSPLDQPVPNDWVTIEGEFISVCACYQTHLGSNLIMAPHARFNDGIIHLCILKAGIPKSELIQLMGMLEKGTHIDHPSPNLEFVKVLAFRLTPEGNEGIIMVDGERVDYGPLQAQVLPGAAHIMAIQ